MCDTRTCTRKKYSTKHFLEKGENGTPKLKISHKYYTQVQAQMWVTGPDHSFFVWTQGHKPLNERINYDPKFCASTMKRITLFYKAYVLPCLLGYTDVFHCPKCSTVILEEPEINKSDDNSVKCDNCSAWWHIVCAGLSEEKASDPWLCHSCLTVGIYADSDSDDNGDGNVIDGGGVNASSNGNGGDDGKVSSVSDVNICSVCSNSSISGGKEHICSVCSNAVHA